MGFSALAQVAPLLTNLALTPYLIRHLGLDRFGVWSLILVFLATLAVLDGGVGASLARFYAYHGARGDRDGTGRLVVGSLTVFFGLGALVTVLSVLVAPAVVAALDVPPHLAKEAEQLLLALGPLLTLALAAHSAIALLQANARFASLAAVSGGSCLVYAVAVVMVIDSGPDLPLLVLLTTGRYLIVTIGGLAAGARHIRIRRPLLPLPSERREFVGYASRMQLSGFTVFLNGEVDAVVIAALLPVRYVGIFAAGYQAAIALRSLPLYAFPPILTRMTHVYAAHELPGAVREFHALQFRWLPAVLTYGAVTTAAVGLAVQVWLGPELALSGAVAAVLLAGYAVQVALTGMRTCFVRAIGRPGLETRYSWCATAVNLVLTVPLTIAFGVVGVVLATSVGIMAGALYFVVLCRRVADLREQHLPKRWAPATALAVTTAVLGDFLVLQLGWQGALPLLLAGIPVLVGLALAWPFIGRELTQGPHTRAEPPPAEEGDTMTGRTAPERGDRRPRRVLIVAQLDGYANSVKPLAIERYLREHGYDVHLADTLCLARASSAAGSLGRTLPGSARPAKLALYANDVVSKVLTRRWSFGRRHLSYYVLLTDHRLRRRILRAELALDDFDLVICETPYDAGVLTTPTSAATLYDCPNPWADEVLNEGRLTPGQHRKLRGWERDFLEEMEYLSFSWETYGRYAQEKYGISGHNFLQLNWGCTPSVERAGFARPPRVAYLGSLSGQFINLPLLSRLSRLYPNIDVYGGPPPDPSLGLNYRGYGSPEVLREYQFGLITCTRDAIREEGFSAKHLHYLAYGLPVLVPAWRRHLDLLRGSVPYTEEDFASRIGALSDAARWQSLSDEAYEQARRLDWNRTLEPLRRLLDGPLAQPEPETRSDQRYAPSGGTGRAP
jgi:O-antigen/teichoic acid export membrane protein